MTAPHPAPAGPAAAGQHLPNPPVLDGGPAGARVDPALLERAHGAAVELARRGIGPGARVAVEAAGADVLAWLLGADLRGAATLVVEPDWSARERAAVLDDVRPDAVVSGSPPGEGAVAPVPGTDVAFYLATTSGSGGRPKVVQRSRASWLASFAALGPVPGPVLVGGPLSASLFLFGALHALWCGAALRLGPRDPAAALEAAATVHVVPAMLATLVDAAQQRRDSGALATIVCGGAHLDAALRARCARVLPGARLVEYYGSAEHSLIAISAGTGLRPVPDLDLEVRDGRLWVRSPLAFDGYLRGGVLDPAAEWTTVGDRGDLAGGVLTVHGRDAAEISSGGRIVGAEEVEAVLRGVAGVTDVLVCASPHPRLTALVTAVVEGEVALRDLRAAARAGLEPAKRPRRWLSVSRLPRTASGKPARAAVAEALAAGTLDARPLT